MMPAWPLLAVADPMEHILPHAICKLVQFDFAEKTLGPIVITNYIPLTNHMLMLLISGGIMLVMFPLLARNYPLVPTGIRSAAEAGLELVRSSIARPVLHEHTDRFMPFLWSLFFFILINNLLGMVPLDALCLIILGRGHMFGTATAGLSVTAGLAICAFLVIHVSGVMQQVREQRWRGLGPGRAAIAGFLKYWYNFVPHVPGVMGLLLFPLLFTLEIIGAVIKPFALAIRLFANMMAGHVVLASLLVMIPVIHGLANSGIAVVAILGCAALSCLELLVAFIQAYIFTFLTCMFIGSAVSFEH